jgi:hypothetical protein
MRHPLENGNAIWRRLVRDNGKFHHGLNVSVCNKAENELNHERRGYPIEVCLEYAERSYPIYMQQVRKMLIHVIQ